MKGLLVSAPSSGAGKTTVSAAIMAALKSRGLRVQPFKCGPDFIDPGHHRLICGRPSHNLDTWMLSTETNRSIFARACRDADVAVVEGMMGLFDGVRGSDDSGSSAEIARLLDLPVVLVVDASAAARSVAAVVYGFVNFDPRVRLAGVVLNQAGGAHHAAMLTDALRGSIRPDLPVAWMPHRPGLKIRERYLGLQTADEQSWPPEEAAALATLIEPSSMLDELLASCDLALPGISEAASQPGTAERVRIGVARDRAFCFYYEAGLDALRNQGAQIVEFSPLADRHLPPDLDGLYFGGGYPELYAEALSGNTGLVQDVRAVAAAGKPVYGECGGLIFLGNQLTAIDGGKWPMAGLLPLSIEMTSRLVRFGYVDVEFTASGLAPAGTRLRGHSFHCSQIVEEGKVEKQTVVRYSISGERQQEGYRAGNVFGSYIHLHFAADRAFAAGFVELARKSREVQVAR